MLNGNYSRMLRAILNKSRKQHPTKRLMYDHLRSISQAIQVIRARHTGYCERSIEQIISDILPWTSYVHTSFGLLAKPYNHQLLVDSECRLEDFVRPGHYRDGWCEKKRKLRESVLSSHLDEGDDKDDDDDDDDVYWIASK